MSLPVENIINLFPYSKEMGNRNSKLFYEQNITNLVRQVTDKDCYIISGEVSSEGVVVDGTLKLSLHGYFVELNESTNLIPEGNTSDTVYVGVILTNDADFPHELDGQVDSNGEFTPIYLSGTIPSDENIHYLPLLKRVDGKWQIPAQSRVKFNLSSIFEIEDIDGLHEIGN